MDARFGDSFFIDAGVKNSYGDDITVDLGAGNDLVKFIGAAGAGVGPGVGCGGAEGAVTIDLVDGMAADRDEADNLIGFDRLIGVTRLRGSQFNDDIAGS